MIDVRENKKSTSPLENSCRDGDRAVEASGTDRSSQNFEEIVAENCKTDAWEMSSLPIEAENGEEDDIIGADTQIPTACVSRSCSICSDQPLLVQNQSSFETDSKILETGSKTLDVDGHRQSDDILKWCIGLTPIVHSQETCSHCICEADSHPAIGLKQAEHSNSAEATVTLSCRSNSVVSCNIRTSDAKLDLLNSSTDRTHVIVKHSVSSEELDWSNFILNYPLESSSL